jgi:hypothetical protein
VKRIPFAEADDFFRHGTRSFSARQRGGDPAMFKQIGDQGAENSAAMGRLLSKF